MDFRDDSGRHLPLLVPRRSLLVMTGESRYDWTHGITPRKLDLVHLHDRLTVRERGSRISFTFRKVCVITNYLCYCAINHRTFL